MFASSRYSFLSPLLPRSLSFVGSERRSAGICSPRREEGTSHSCGDILSLSLFPSPVCFFLEGTLLLSSPSSSSVFHVVAATANKPSWPSGRLRSSDTNTQTHKHKTETHKHLSALFAVREEHKLLITANLTVVLSALKVNHCSIVCPLSVRQKAEDSFVKLSLDFVCQRLVFVLCDLLFGSSSCDCRKIPQVETYNTNKPREHTHVF